MTESDTHKFIKNKIAESLSEIGFDVKTEVVTKEGRLDVLASKDGHELKVEVYKTHIPDWLLVKVHGDINEPKPHTISDRKQLNLPNDVIGILDDFGERHALCTIPLKYPDVIRAMAAKLDPKKYGKKK